MARPKRTARTVSEWESEATDRPVIAELLRSGDAFRDAIARREPALEAERRAREELKAVSALYQERAERVREAVLEGAEEGLTTADIAEILGINESWVMRIRAAGRGRQFRAPSTGPKMLRPPLSQR